MGQRIIISEEDKNRIKGLYEQTSSKPFNFFTYKDTVHNMIESMTSLMENIERSKLCQSLDNQLQPTFGLVDDLVARMAADNGMSEGESLDILFSLIIKKYLETTKNRWYATFNETNWW